MDRTRESRRSTSSITMPSSTTNAFPRRRNRTIALRDSSEEGQVQVQETVRLRALPSKRDKDRDRDFSNRNKRRRGSHSHRDAGDQSTDESVGNEQDYDLQDAGLSRILSPNTASSAYDQNHRRTFTPAIPLRPTPPPPWKVTDEMIGVTVPRRARSASVKRPHESWVSASGGGVEEQNFRQRSSSPGRQSAGAASPSSSNVSVRKKMKAIGPDTHLPKASKSSSSTQEDIEIEIAELLYGLRTSKNQESSSQKREGSDTRSSSITNHQTSAPPTSTSPSPFPSTDIEERKAEDYNSSTIVPNNSTGESVKIESEQPAKVEMLAPESAKISGCRDDNATGHETGSSDCPKESIEEDNVNSGAGCGVTADGRSISFTGESPSCPKPKLDIDKQDSASTRVISAVSEANSQRTDKFEIDLMAPPPMMPSPERDDLSRGYFTSETKALALDVEMKREDGVKVGNKVERLVKKETKPEEIEQVKMEVKLDLETPNKYDDMVTNNKLEDQDKNKGQPTKWTNPKVEKTVQSSSVPLPTAVPGRPSSVSPLGYMPHLQTMVKIDKAVGSSMASQHVNFVLSQPRPKRCATHRYIARNILHQQFIKMNPLLPAATGSSSVCGAKPNSVNCMPSTESLAVGKQSQKHLPGVNQSASHEKGWAATGDPSVTASKGSGIANSMDSTQRKQLVLQQGPHPGSTGNLMHGPAFLFPPGQHQASVTTASTQAVGVNSTSSASSSNKSHSPTVGSLCTSSTLPAVAASMTFSYPNLPANDAPYVTIVQNNGYPFPFSTSFGATAAIRGASPAQATPILNGPFYSSQMFHAVQHPQQHPQSQALVQPSYLNASTSSGSSSSHKQPQGMQVNGNKILTSTTTQLQQKQHPPPSHPRKLETETGGENNPSVASQASYSQKNVFGQNFTIPVQPLNFSFRPSATSDSVGGISGNSCDKQQQQQALKGGVELIPSQAFAISFGAFNGANVPSNLNFSSMAQNPVLFQSLPDIAWHGYQGASTSHTTQQKGYSMTEVNSGGNSSHHDDEKKAASGKPSNNGPTTLVFDNSSKNLNFGLSPMDGNRPSRSTASTATTASVPLSCNASNSQQPPHLLHLQKHGMQQQQPAMATRYKASSTNTTAASKFVNNPPVFSQTMTECRSSTQASQSKNLGRISDSQVHNTPIITSTTPTLKSFSPEQGRVLHGHMQISFGGNYISSLPLQGQQLLNNNQPLCTTVAGTPPNGGNLRPNSLESKVNTSQMPQTENSSAGTGQKSSPVCGRNVPSILSSCPSQLSELKY